MDATAQFEGSAADVPEARRFVRQTLEDAADAEALDNLLVLVSEATTNVVVHAHTAFRVSLHWDGSVAHLEVVDRNPQPGEQPLDGLARRVLTGLADRWGVDRRAEGKAVWFDAIVPRR